MSTVYCSFCGLGHPEVREMVTAENVAICDQCILKCVSVMFEARGKFMFWLGAEAERV